MDDLHIKLVTGSYEWRKMIRGHWNNRINDTAVTPTAEYELYLSDADSPG